MAHFLSTAGHLLKKASHLLAGDACCQMCHTTWEAVYDWDSEEWTVSKKSAECANCGSGATPWGYEANSCKMTSVTQDGTACPEGGSGACPTPDTPPDPPTVPPPDCCRCNLATHYTLTDGGTSYSVRMGVRNCTGVAQEPNWNCYLSFTYPGTPTKWYLNMLSGANISIQRHYYGGTDGCDPAGTYTNDANPSDTVTVA